MKSDFVFSKYCIVCCWWLRKARAHATHETAASINNNLWLLMMRAQAMLSLPDAAVYPKAGMWRMDGGAVKLVGRQWQ
jgi:hypothetical protein